MKRCLVFVSLTVRMAEATAADTPADSTAVMQADGRINPRLLRRFRPITRPGGERPTPTESQIVLGRMLWFDARLSRGHEVSCDSCHPLATYGADGARVSVGQSGRAGRRPTRMPRSPRRPTRPSQPPGTARASCSPC